MLKVQLTRDLRKNVLRGHPWIYREAIQVPSKANKACLCEVLDKKKKPLGWAIYSPEGPLALRIISTEKKPPNQNFFESRMSAALKAREGINRSQTNAFRLFNGEGDGLPGMVCDVYGSLAILQFDGDSCYEFWDQEFVAGWLISNAIVEGVYCKPRRNDNRDPLTFGEIPKDDLVDIKENGNTFVVNFVDGQKTGFFLDQRDNREYLRSISKDKTVLNLFSYTGGFSIYAGMGGAKNVKSVDLSAPALELARESWEKNDLSSEGHETLAVDVFDYIDGESGLFDIVMVDPPSMTHSEKTKVQAVKAYTDLFAKTTKLVGPGKHLVLSSCSSHISFEGFLEIIDEALSMGRRTGKIVRISGQGIDHPIPHFCRELRYLKFVDVILN